MDNIISNSLGLCVNYIKTKYNNYKLIETQHKIVYFSAFSLEINDFITIYAFTKKIKESLFKKLLDATKLAVNQCFTFSNNTLSEKEKVLIVFSACFLYYYTSFSYDQCDSFNAFFTQNLIELYQRFSLKIIDMSKFKVYCYLFYYQIINELKQINYPQIKSLYNYKTQQKNPNSIEGIKGVVDKKIITPLISAKERIVNMVYSMSSMNTQQKQTPSNTQGQEELDKADFEKIKSRLYEIYTNNEESLTQQDIPMSSNDNTITNTPMFSKRILCELVKCNFDNQLNDVINTISQEFDTAFLESKLSLKGINDIDLIFPFLCYIIELKALDLATIFPNLPNDYIFRYILPSKNIYLQALEIYFSIHDLAYTQMNSFLSLIQYKLSLQNNHHLNEGVIKSLLNFFKMLTEQLLQNTQGSNTNEEQEMFTKLLVKLEEDWKVSIMQKCQELTTFLSP